jgi:hypothetical protein
MNLVHRVILSIGESCIKVEGYAKVSGAIPSLTNLSYNRRRACLLSHPSKVL